MITEYLSPDSTRKRHLVQGNEDGEKEGKRKGEANRRELLATIHSRNCRAVTDSRLRGLHNMNETVE